MFGTILGASPASGPLQDVQGSGVTSCVRWRRLDDRFRGQISTQTLKRDLDIWQPALTFSLWVADRIRAMTTEEIFQKCALPTQGGKCNGALV